MKEGNSAGTGLGDVQCLGAVGIVGVVILEDGIVRLEGGLGIGRPRRRDFNVGELDGAVEYGHGGIW